MFGRFLLAAALLLAVLPASAQTKLKVVATFSILGDLVGEVGGEQVDLSVSGRSRHRRPHLSTQADRRAHPRRGPGAGEQRPGFRGLDRSSRQGRPLQGSAIVASNGVPTIAAGPAHGHSHAHGPDPHCWQDVACVRRYVANIAKGLAEADPANAARYRDRAALYDQQLAELDQWIKGEIAKVPAEPAQGDHRARLVPLLLEGLWRAVPWRRAATTPRASRRRRTSRR